MNVAAPVKPDQCVVLSAGVARLTAPNSSALTGSGTNAYLLGDGPYCVIDPGPADAAHVARLLDMTQGRIAAILVTHTHPDHSPAARLLKSETGAPIYAHRSRLQGVRDIHFRADRFLDDGDVFRMGELELFVMHTPGHAADHLCYLDLASGWFFVGDQLMGGATVVISPPDGDLATYLRSLRRMSEAEARYAAPAHGPVFTNPAAEIGAVLAHRQHREEQILRAVSGGGVRRISEIVTDVYSGLSRELVFYAAQSVHAHLLKLLDEDRVRRTTLNGEEAWCAISNGEPNACGGESVAD